jgi:hypothetical protein
MFGSFNYVALLHSLLAKFRRLRAGSGALWRPWYDGGRHGDRELARLRCVVVFCVSIVRKLLPRGKTAREQFLPSSVQITNNLHQPHLLHPMPILPMKVRRCFGQTLYK